ncbi:MAG: hypothetical protein WCE94_06760 [Candidatus Methanoperedens sp.]
MVNYWIFVAKRPDGDYESIKEVIEGKEWDFVGSKKPFIRRTPPHALRLCKNDRVLFYLSDKDQSGKILNPLYPYKSFIAYAILDSAFDKERLLVKLRDKPEIFKKPVRYNNYCYFGLCNGPTTIALLNEFKFNEVLRRAHI